MSDVEIQEIVAMLKNSINWRDPKYGYKRSFKFDKQR